jgi:hypothetical protein
MNFKYWLEANTIGTEEVQDKISSIYNKGKCAIELAQQYDKSKNLRLLFNIGVVAPLSGKPHTYGLFLSSENKHILSKKAEKEIQLKFNVGDLKTVKNFDTIPFAVLKKYVPDLSEQDLMDQYTVHVDVNQIVKDHGDTPKAVIEIARSIIHEALHAQETRYKGTTADAPRSPEVIQEEDFQKWADSNKAITSSIMKKCFPNYQG